jgi:hypothetical protein
MNNKIYILIKKKKKKKKYSKEISVLNTSEMIQYHIWSS